MDTQALPSVGHSNMYQAPGYITIPVGHLPDWVCDSGDEFSFTHKGWEFDKLTSRNKYFIESVLLSLDVCIGFSGFAVCKIIKQHRIYLYSFCQN